jgi:hypothetical protein
MTTAIVPATCQLVVSHAEGNKYYAKAIQTPAYLEAVALWDEATRKRAQLPPIPDLPLPNSVDDTDLDDWLDVAVRVDDLQRARAVKFSALSSLITKQESIIQSIVGDKDRLLAALGQDMDAVMRQATDTVLLLNGADTPSAVIATGKGDVWTELGSIRDEYDSIRQAQDWVLAGDHRIAGYGSPYLDDPLASDTQISNLDSVFPSWRTPPQNHAIIRGNTPRLQPWPPDGVGQLVWLCTSGAKVWCPTFRELDELKRRRLLERAHPNGDPQQQPDHPPTAAPPTNPFDRIITPLEAAAL